MGIGSRARRMMATLLMLSPALALPAMAADIPSEATLFKNVKILDGKSDKREQDIRSMNDGSRTRRSIAGLLELEPGRCRVGRRSTSAKSFSALRGCQC